MQWKRRIYDLVYGADLHAGEKDRKHRRKTNLSGQVKIPTDYVSKTTFIQTYLPNVSHRLTWYMRLLCFYCKLTWPYTRFRSVYIFINPIESIALVLFLFFFVFKEQGIIWKGSDDRVSCTSRWEVGCDFDLLNHKWLFLFTKMMAQGVNVGNVVRRFPCVSTVFFNCCMTCCHSLLYGGSFCRMIETVLRDFNPFSSGKFECSSGRRGFK